MRLPPRVLLPTTESIFMKKSSLASALKALEEELIVPFLMVRHALGVLFGVLLLPPLPLPPPLWSQPSAFVSCRNSRVRKSRKELAVPRIWSMVKSKTESSACHLVKIYLDARFLTSFSITLLAEMQSMRKRKC